MLERRGDSIVRRAELQCARGEVLQRAGLGAQAGQALADAGTLAAAAGRRDLIARSALGMGGAGVTILGTDPEVYARLQNGLTAIGDDHPGLRVRLLARLAIELAYDADPARRDDASREALELAHRIDDPAAVAAALSARHVTAWGPDGGEERLRLADEMLELAERGVDRELALQARNWRIVDLLELGDGPAVRAELDTYAELAAQVRLPAFAWYVPLWRATVALLEGRLADGVELSRRALQLGRRAGDANADVFYAEQYLGRMLVQGRMRDVDPAVGGVVDRRHGPCDQRPGVACVQVHICLVARRTGRTRPGPRGLRGGRRRWLTYPAPRRQLAGGAVLRCRGRRPARRQRPGGRALRAPRAVHDPDGRDRPRRQPLRSVAYFAARGRPS